MKKRILLPTSFFFSVLFTVFLFGFIIGMLGLYGSIDHFHTNSTSNNHTNSEENEAIVTVDEILDGDTIYIKLDDNLKKKLGTRFKYLDKYKINETNKKVISDTEIHDIEINKMLIKVRLHGIDAPEDKYTSLEKTFYASKTKEFVEDQIMNKSHQRIKINWEHSQKVSRRLLAYVYTQDDKGKYDNTSLNELMLQEGYAWVFRRNKAPIRHPKEEQFNNLENEAKRTHKGVWNIEEKIKWQKEQGIIPSDKSNTYLIIGNFFHRELCNCKEVNEARGYQKNYLQNREEIAKSYTACKYCNP